MSDGFTWLQHGVHGGFFRCPDGAVEVWEAKDWQRCDPPFEENPATAERPTAPAAAPADEPSKPTKATKAAGTEGTE